MKTKNRTFVLKYILRIIVYDMTDFVKYRQNLHNAILYAQFCTFSYYFTL